MISTKTPSNGSSLGIRGRLLIGFGTITTILILMVGITLIVISSLKNTTVQSLEVELPTYDAFLNLGMDVYHSQTLLQEWILTKNPAIKTNFNLVWDNNLKVIINQLNQLEKNWTQLELINNWDKVKNYLIQLNAAQDKLINADLNAITSENLNKSINDINLYLEKIFNLIDGFKNEVGVRKGGIFDIQLAQLQNSTASVMHYVNVIQISEYVLSIIFILSAFTIALSTSNAIINHINKFRKHSSRIASGDLRQYLNLESNDEMGQLGNDLNVMTQSLAAITKQIIEASHNMVVSLDEVQHVVNSQSSGASEQAASINQITVSLEEIEKSSMQTMEKAQALGEIAERTQAKGQLGLDAVEQSTKGMKAVRDKVQVIAQTILELSNQTQQVGEITAVVNTLAQQSKMLALNASIEAAKAGDAGKGFAVVAVEVKNLAEQSEQATSQVQKILENIRHAAEKAVMVTEEGTKGVDHGTNLVEQTGDVVRSLTDVIHETTIASQQIEAAVRQESVGIEQITAGMTEINKVTSSFVESVHQTTEAISNLAGIAKNLKEQVDIYKT